VDASGLRKYLDFLGKKNMIMIIDDFVKSLESRHSRESRSPELPELTGFPLLRE
jgi:hypothetical protein